MRFAGILLSGLAHVVLIWLALHAPPWLRPPREKPVQVVTVEFVSAADLAAAETAARARRAVVARPPVVAPPPAAPGRAPARVAAPAPIPEAEPEAEPAPSLAPAVGEAVPFGIGEALLPDPNLPSPPILRQPAASTEPRAGEAERGAPVDAEAAAAAAVAYAAAVQTAILRARVYPRIARDRGLIGEARLLVVVDRGGRLVNARVVASAGSRTLDDAALAAARNARLPPAPEALPGQRFSFEVPLGFSFHD